MAFEEIKKFIKDKKIKTDEGDIDKIAVRLKYLQYDISAILAPYLIKMESVIKGVSQSKWDPESTLKACITTIAKTPSDFLNEENPKHIYVSRTIESADLAKNLELYRVARNKVMHESDAWIIEQVSINDFKGTFNNEKLKLTYEEIKTIFNRKYWNSPSAPGFVEKSFLQILLTIIYLFNKEKVSRKILAEIDYEIYTFIRSWDVESKTLYNALGLHEDWLTKMMG